MALAEERLRELPDDGGAAQADEGIVALQGGDDRARRVGVAGPVVIRDDDLEPEPCRLLDLGDGRDAAVDRQDELDALSCEARERLHVEPVAFLESRREVPGRIGAELAEQEDRERGGADAVGVVVAVDADLLPGRHRGPDGRDRLGHVADPQRVVPGQRALEEHPSLRRIRQPPANEHGCERGADPELRNERSQLVGRTGTDRPGGLLHRRSRVRRRPDGALSRAFAETTARPRRPGDDPRRA